MKLVVVTSPATDAGKTFLATGLTETAAAFEYKVIYIDLDKPVGDSLNDWRKSLWRYSAP